MSKLQKILSVSKQLQTLEETGSITQEDKYSIINEILEDESFINLAKNKKNWTYEEHDDFLYLLDLPKDSGGYYLSKFQERCAYNGIRDLKRGFSIMDLSQVHLNEIEKIKDYNYYRKYYIKIVTRAGISRPEPRLYQTILENELLELEDTVVLFPRQSGKSVTTGIYLLYRALTKDNINIGIVSNKRSGAAEVLDKIKKIYMELPIWLQKGIMRWNGGDIEFDNNVRIMTDAPSSDAFRGFTINIVYIDECAYVPKRDWDAFSDAVFPTMNSLIFKQIILTSTANGVNHFSELVKQAKQPESEYRFVECDWKEVPRFKKDGTKYKTEEYKKSVIRKFGLKYWLQTEENEFLGSSDTLVSGETLKRIQEHIENIQLDELPQSPFSGCNIYHKPKKTHSYICSVDSSKDGVDDFTFNIIDITKFPFVQVADANLQVDYLVMPEYLVEIGEWYNNAFMIIENNEGSGQSIADTMFSVYSYENLYRDKKIDGQIGHKKYPGFRTSQKSRSRILGLLKAFLEEGKLILNSQVSIQQLYTFVKNDAEKYIAQAGYKDDNIMSLAISFAPFMESVSFDDFELFIKELKMDAPTVHTKDFISTLDLAINDDGSDNKSDYEKTKESLEQMGSLDSFEDYGIPESFQDSLNRNWK